MLWFILITQIISIVLYSTFVLIVWKVVGTAVGREIRRLDDRLEKRTARKVAKEPDVNGTEEGITSGELVEQWRTGQLGRGTGPGAAMRAGVPFVER